ncbi:MAG: cation:proton antiporter [Cyanobacteriota bacterium]
MNIPHFFIEIAIIFVFASISGLILSRFKQPPIVAYILTGILLGPQVFALVTNEQLVNELSEIGVIALLFTLGLEFSFSKFNEIRNSIIFLGLLQIIGTLVLVSIIMSFFDFNFTQCILIGCAIALSSTVVVLRTLTSAAQLDSIHGRIILGILIVQDLSLIPIMIILPNLMSGEGSILFPLFIAIIKAVLFLGIALIISFGVTPLIMNLITSSNKEFLILSSIGIAIGTAIVASYFGISLALGAFVAGLALSGTMQSKQVIAEVVPLRDVFAMVFFVSIGMLLDINFFFENILLVLVVVVVIFLIKFTITFCVVYFSKYPGQTALWAALSLFQIGEFSFIIAQLGFMQKVISENIYSLFITSTLLTMLITPFIVKQIPNILSFLQKSNIWNKHFKGPVVIEKDKCELNNHIIVCGFGPIGRSIAKVLSLSHQDYIVIELNNKSIFELKSERIQAIYGDATHEEILSHANVEKARVIIITLPDIKSCEMAVMNARKLNNDIFIIVRSRYQPHIDILYNAGANVVIYEEYETSLGIIVNVLEKLKYSQNEIETIIYLIQSDKFKIIQNLCKEEVVCRSTVKSIKESEVLWIKANKSHPFIGKPILYSKIREKSGASIISITKDSVNYSNPPPETIIEDGNILAILGNPDQIKKLNEMLSTNN